MAQKEIVIDGKNHLEGRLAAACAKELLEGAKITVVRCEDLRVSGSLFRNRLKFMEFLRKKSNSNPRVHSHIHYRSPSLMFKRVLRGMLPHKTPRGAAALKRLTVMEGIPGLYNMKKRVVVPEALAHLRIKPKMASCRLGDLASSVGWKYDTIVAKLESKRKDKSTERYQKRRDAAKELRMKREQAIASAPQDVKEALALIKA